jgi:hypothetical protein
VFFIEKKIPRTREAYPIALELQDQALQDLIPLGESVEEHHAQRLERVFVDVCGDVRRVDPMGLEGPRAEERD